MPPEKPLNTRVNPLAARYNGSPFNGGAGRHTPDLGDCYRPIAGRCRAARALPVARGIVIS